MNTFLPERDFFASVKALDNRRLGCQRKEVSQILGIIKLGPRSLPKPKTLISPDGKPYTFQGKERATPWYNHPACRMWRGFEPCLIDYGLAACIEWKSRGFLDVTYDKILSFADDFPGSSEIMPPWYNDALIETHRSNLIRKNPAFYQPKWPQIRSDLEYLWPV
jgi:hypothetical protein